MKSKRETNAKEKMLRRNKTKRECHPPEMFLFDSVVHVASKMTVHVKVRHTQKTAQVLTTSFCTHSTTNFKCMHTTGQLFCKDIQVSEELFEKRI